MIKVNGRIFGSEQFSNGEVSYKPVAVKPDCNRIELFFQDNKDLADLQFAVEFLRDKEPGTKIELVMLYVPYGRMDRPIDGYVYSLKMFANIINRLEFSCIYTLDNHSSGIMNLLYHVIELDINPYIDKARELFQPDYLFFPDAGAMKKYPQKITACANHQIPYFYGEKQRVLDDSREIISYRLFNNDLSLNSKKILIIDDICCTGGTVLRAANIMRQRGVADIALWVAHCENNVIKYDIVRENSSISRIYTSDSIIRNYAIPEIEVIHPDE